tara:strand:+ start:285 stop:431 length:147 start_codon:yes stop_codon:yes gene_type:complete
MEKWITIKIPRTLKTEAETFCGDDKPFTSFTQLSTIAIHKEIERLQNA